MHSNGTDWLKSLAVNDKLDVLDNSSGIWYGFYVGTIIGVKYTPNISFLVHYDGYKSNCDKWIDIDDTGDEEHTQLRRLNSITPFHDYLVYKNGIYHGASNFMKPCRWRAFDETVECEICKRKCCKKCFAVNVHTVFVSRKKIYIYHCKDCIILSQYQYLFAIIKAFYDSIFNQQLIELNIIDIITYYSFDYNITCCNEICGCSNTICFDGQLEKQIIKYYGRLTENVEFNFTKYKNRRILCSSCTTLKKKQRNREKCRVFHDDPAQCIRCQHNLCIKCDDHENCSKCFKLFCIDCFVSVRCDGWQDAFVCDECYPLSFICDRCDGIICNECPVGTELKDVKKILKCNECSGIIYTHCDHNQTAFKVNGNTFCYDCKGKKVWYHCHGCKTKICSKCKKNYKGCSGCSKLWCQACVKSAKIRESNDVLLCNECYSTSFKCDKCARIICHKCVNENNKTILKCNECHNSIGIGCNHNGTAFNINDTIICYHCHKNWIECNGCCNKICRKCAHRIENCNDCDSLIQNEWLMDYELLSDNLSMKRLYILKKKAFRKNNKRYRCKNKRKFRSYLKRKNDKKSNTKQIRKFNKKYIFSLQY